MTGPVLTAGRLSLGLAPELGGSVASFRRDGVDLMRPLVVPPGAAPHALYSAMFPMLPFANSIRDNRFVFAGRDYEVTPNMPGGRLNYHGSGWQQPWAVASARTDSAELVLVDGAVDDVYRFAGRQRFALDGDGLSVSVSLENRGEAPMPFGFGLHPWFPRHGEAIVSFGASDYWLEDADFNAERLCPAEGARDFSAGRAPERAYHNVCYAGWDRRARIDWPRLGLSLEIDADPVFRHLMFHVPAHDFDTICLEPQSNAVSAFDGLEAGRLPAGVHILAPGEILAGTIRFGVSSN